MQRVTKVPGLSDEREIPRLGKIRLGIKKKGAKGEYPAEVDYFVVPPEVTAVYGPDPKELDIMFLTNDAEANMPTAYKRYGSSAGLKCIGDGAGNGYEKTDEGEKKINCPCDHAGGEKPSCKIVACIMVVLPEVSAGGVYQISTGSIVNIKRVNSYMDWIKRINPSGGCALVRIKLSREEIETAHKGGSKKKHHVLKLAYMGTVADVRALAGSSGAPGAIAGTPTAPISGLQMPEPDDSNPALDTVEDGAKIIDEEAAPDDAEEQRDLDYDTAVSDFTRDNAELINEVKTAENKMMFLGILSAKGLANAQKQHLPGVGPKGREIPQKMEYTDYLAKMLQHTGEWLAAKEKSGQPGDDPDQGSFQDEGEL